MIDLSFQEIAAQRGMSLSQRPKGSSPGARGLDARMPLARLILGGFGGVLRILARNVG